LVVISAGAQETDTDVTAGPDTFTVAEPDLVASWVDVAVIVAVAATVSVAFGVNTPVPLTVPALAGLTVHLTAVLKLPVPFTVAAQALVCATVTVAGVHATATEVMAGPTTVTVAMPDLVESWPDVAVIVVALVPVRVEVGV
jgi:hypothetical protein